MAITSDELQSIVSAVLSSIRTNSRTIDQLTPVTALADTDNIEVHGGKRVVFSILRNLILSKSGVDELKTELKPKLAELDDVVEIHSVRSDIGVILAQPSGPLTVYHGSTDEGYGVVYDSTRKRFYLVGTSTLPNPNTDVSVIQAYGDWSDEAVFGDSPESGSGRIPVRGKLYVCATDGGLYYWNGTDLVDLIKGILANTNALTILNRRGQVESFAAVLTSDPDDDPIPEELVGKRVWSTQFNRFLDITATEEVGGVYPYTVPDDAAAVENKFYISDDNLYLGIKRADTTTSLLPLFATAIAEHSHTHKITLTRVADLRYSWSGAALGDIRQGDILTWTDTDEMFRAVVFGERTSGTRREVCAMFTRDGDEAIEFSLLWFHENGEAYETVFDSSQTLAWQFAACQNKLTDTADIQVRAEARPSGQHYTPYGLYLKDSAKMRLFIDQWDAAWKVSGTVYGKYDPENAPDAEHPFMGNEIWMTYEEAILVMEYSSGFSAFQRISLVNIPIKTLLPIPLDCYDTYVDIMLMRELRAIRFICVNKDNAQVTSQQPWFISKCPNLTKIEGTFNISNMGGSSCFRFLRSSDNIKEFRASGLNKHLNLQTNSKLSLATMQYLVDNASTAITAEKPVVVTVHADVFAKLTGDTTNEAAAALTDDEKTAWAAVLTAATSKYISFATD